MISRTVAYLGDFTKKLLIGDTFDAFLLSRAQIVTGTTLTLDGHLNAAYFDTPEDPVEADAKGSAPVPAYASWAECKALAFHRIKGNRLPLSFQFVLMANDAMTQALCTKADSLQPEQIAGLFLNIAYNGADIVCTTGISLHTFTLDQTAAHLWDEEVEGFFKMQQIALL